LEVPSLSLPLLAHHPTEVGQPFRFCPAVLVRIIEARNIFLSKAVGIATIGPEGIF
jgi:hypothetical protein